MAACRVLLPVLVVGAFAIATKGISSVYETTETIASYGYPVETHHVTTSDGYILEMHRIPHGRNQSPFANRPAVFLMHGLMAASNSYIALGPEHAPAYNLADAGFDVWMGNARGNKISRYHVSLNPDNSTEKYDFFDFTWEEIALYDLPAMIDYILIHTGQEKLHYIGHSQGGTVFLVLNSILTEYNEKIASAHLLAGVGYMNYFPNEELREIARLTDIIYNAALLIGFVEIDLPSYDEVESLDQRINQCTGDPKTSYMCEVIGLRQLLRNDADIETNPLDSDLFGGAALKQIAHYGQNIRDKSFRRWSYNIFQNMQVYGTRNPPEYDLSLITVNVTMHYTVNDILLDERDVLDMAADMPNTVARKVARETFEHVDFVAALDSKELVTDYILETLKRDSGMTIEYENTIDSSQNQENQDHLDNGISGVVSPVTASGQHLALNTVLKMYLLTLSLVLSLV